MVIKKIFIEEKIIEQGLYTAKLAEQECKKYNILNPFKKTNCGNFHNIGLTEDITITK